MDFSESVTDAHKIEVTLTEDGKLILDNIPFKKGDTVEVIILEHALERNSSSPRDRQPYQYNDPFEPAISPEEWEVLK